MVTIALAIAACGDKDSSGQRDAAPADTSDPDATVIVDAPTDAFCAPPAAGKVGGACTGDSQCDSSSGSGDGFCLRGGQGTTIWPAEGYCVNKVDTCTDDASCGTGNACVSIDDPASAYKACLPSCGTGACACGSGQICASSLGGAPFLASKTACAPGTASATDGAACADIGDCSGDSRCALEVAEVPGGQCQRLGCTVGTDSTCAAGGDGHCVTTASITGGVGTGELCVDACTVPGDCRQAEGYRCFDAGGSIGKYCRHPQIGDACGVDTDCGSATDWDCLTGSAFPGGYCTLAAACPTAGSVTGCTVVAGVSSSACHDPAVGANYCADRCAGPAGTQAQCRTGYTCTDIDPGGGTVLGCLVP